MTIMRKGRVPANRAAATKSRSRRERVSARTNRATPIHEVSPMTTIIVLRLGSKNAITARIRKKEGKQSMTSTPRMMISSTMPLKYPASSPKAMPMAMEMLTETKPTQSETRAP